MAFLQNSKNFSSYSKEIKKSLIRFFIVTALVILPVCYDLFSHLFLGDSLTLGRLINIVICIVLLYLYYLGSVDSKFLNFGKSHAYKVNLKDLAKSISLPLYHIQTKQKLLSTQIESNCLDDQNRAQADNETVNTTLYTKDAYSDYESTRALDPTYNNYSSFNHNCNPSAKDCHTSTFNSNPFDNYHFDKEASFDDASQVSAPQYPNNQSTSSLIDELEHNCNKYLAQNASSQLSHNLSEQRCNIASKLKAKLYALASNKAYDLAKNATSYSSSKDTAITTAATATTNTYNSTFTPSEAATVAHGVTSTTATEGENTTTATIASENESSATGAYTAIFTSAHGASTTCTTATADASTTSYSNKNTDSESNLIRATQSSVLSKALFKGKATPNYYLHKDFNPEITYAYLGKGFEFKPDHTRLLNNLLNTGLIFNSDECHGSLQIHELEKRNDKSLYTLTSNLKGHTIIFGTTGSGKTRAFDLFISQAILRNEVVIVIDPKGDRDLKANLYKVAALIGRKDSVEVLDLVNLKNTTSPFNLLGSSRKPTQIADRLTSLMSNKDNDFANYAHQAVAAAVIAIFFKQQDLTLRNITNNLNLNSLYEGVLNYIITFLVKTNVDALIDVFYCFVKDFKLNFDEFDFGKPLKDKILNLQKEKQLQAELAKVRAPKGSSITTTNCTLNEASIVEVNSETQASLSSDNIDAMDALDALDANASIEAVEAMDAKASIADSALSSDTISTIESNCSNAKDHKDKETKTTKGTTKSKKSSSKGATSKANTKASSSLSSNSSMDLGESASNNKLSKNLSASSKALGTDKSSGSKSGSVKSSAKGKDAKDKDSSAGGKSTVKRLSFIEKVTRIEKLCLRLNELDDRFEITSDLETLLRLCKLDATYFAKVTAGIHPILNTLCLSDLDKYLSANYSALTISQVYKENKILYVALNSLKDTTLATYVGKLLLSDMASTVADIYTAKENRDINFKIAKNKQQYLKDLENTELQSFDNLFEFQNLKRKISVFIDEASEIANEPMLQLLNKSRGAEVNITLATQSYADLVKRTGSVSSARQIIANCNTKFSLRVKDDETARVFTNELQYTSIYQKANAIGQNSLSEAITGSDNNSYSKRQTQAELFPPSVLSSLPDFEYVAKLSDGRFVKGVFPILDVESEFGELDDKNNKPKKKSLFKAPRILSKSMMTLCFQCIVVVKVLMYCIKTLTYPFYKFFIFPIIYPFISPFIRSSKKKRMVKRKVKVTRRYRRRYKKHSIYYLKGYEFFQDNLAFSKAYAKKLSTYDYKSLQDLKAPVASHQFRLKVANNSVSYKITHLDQVEIIEQGFNEFLKQQHDQDNNNIRATGIDFTADNDAKKEFDVNANAEKSNTLTISTLNSTKPTGSDFTSFMQSTFEDRKNSDDHDVALPFIEHDSDPAQAQVQVQVQVQVQEQVQACDQTKGQDQSATTITDHNKAQVPTEFFDLKPSQVQDNLNQNEDVQNLRSLDDKNLEENDIDGNRTSNTNTADTNTNDNANAPAPAPAPAPASNLVINDMDLQVLNDVNALQGLNDSKDSLRENLKSSLKSSLKDTFKENLELFKANQDHNSPQETKTCNLSSSNDTNFSSKDPKSFDAKLSAMRETQNCVDSSCSKTCNGCCVPDSSSNSDKEDLHYPQNNSKSSYTADNFDAQGQGQDQENEFDYETFISSLSDDDKAYLSRQAVAATYSHPSSLFKYELKDPLSESNGCNDLKKALAKGTLATMPIDKLKSKVPENYVSVNHNPVNVDPKDLKTQNTCSSKALTRENRDKDKLQADDPLLSSSKAVAITNANATLQSIAIFKTCPWSNTEFNLDLFKARFNSSKTKLIQRYHTLNKLNILFYSLLSSSVNQGFTNEPYIKLSSKSQIKRFETNLCKPIFQRFGLTKSITFTLDTNLNKENNYVQRNLNYRISSAKCNCTFTTSSYLNHPKLDTAIADDFDKNQRQVKIDLYKSFASLQQVKKVLLKDFALKKDLTSSISLNRYFSSSKDSRRSFIKRHQPFDNYLIFNLEKAQNFFYQENLPNPIEVILKDLNSSLEYKPNLKPQSYRAFKRLSSKDYLYKSCYKSIRIIFAK